MSNCGTYSGYSTHIQKKEKPCDSCRLASNKYRREKRKIDNDLLGYDPRRFKKHGITKELYDEMLSKYNGKCWSCQESEGAVIDHDHRCCPKLHSCGNCIRGILCHECNTAIGLLKDDPEKLKKAVQYLLMGS